MLNNQGFNVWAAYYDNTVQVSEENNQYPFAGYTHILDMICNEVMQKKNSSVLDIGFGTGILSSKLYENGHRIDGIDFSTDMIAIAQPKMPKANLLEWDILNGMPEAFYGNTYDYIISTYTLHHFTDEKKVSIINTLLSMLNKNGKICIGDISFETREKLEKCRQENVEFWDNEEFYFVYNEINILLKGSCICEFYPLSLCGGVMIITK
ncbi:class I SAM-dependent methyltransferase [Bacillus sp. 1P06AnD]|uniref:class I SAM-dependent methyltransferase n=1 Tax=Bacillus sp. 1P06AnD TaxID=3132208 RepID=UPI00399F8089